MLNRNYNFTLRNSNTNSDQKSSAIRSVYRAVDILVCLSNGINSLTDITNHTKLTKPTVFRLLKTLEELRMVTQDPITHQYYLGPLINQIASNPETNHHYLITCALGELKQLWEFSGETVELDIMVGLQYRRIYAITSRYELKVESVPDTAGPVFVGAAAKVLLSQLDDVELKTALKHIKIRHVTDHSVINRAELMSQVKAVRDKGYSISFGERIEGAMSISIPVSGYFWPVALAIVGPVARFQPKADKYLKESLASAGRISDNLTEFFQEKGVIVEKQRERSK
jgi:IclR family KDG regulon transcriptional repressor